MVTNQPEVQGQRALTEEGEQKKAQILTRSKPSQSRPELHYPTIDEMLYRKLYLTLREHVVDIFYLPNYYYVTTILNYTFTAVKGTMQYRKQNEFNSISFQYYCQIILFYYHLRCVDETMKTNYLIKEAIQIIEMTGLPNAPLPAIARHWISDLGTFKDPSSGDQFIPLMPNFSQNPTLREYRMIGEEMTTYLPHFLSLTQLARFFSLPNFNFNETFKKELSYFAVNKSVVGNIDNANIMTFARNFANMIPGFNGLSEPTSHDDHTLLASLGRKHHPNPILDYMCFDSDIWTQLLRIFRRMSECIETITVGSIPTSGTSMVMVPAANPKSLAPTPGNALVINKIDVVPPEEPIALEKVAMIHNRPSPEIQFYARSEIINGSLLTSIATPVVKIQHTYDAVQFSSKSSDTTINDWYAESMTFRTDSISHDRICSNSMPRKL